MNNINKNYYERRTWRINWLLVAEKIVSAKTPVFVDFKCRGTLQKSLKLVFLLKRFFGYGKIKNEK